MVDIRKARNEVRILTTAQMNQLFADNRQAIAAENVKVVKVCSVVVGFTMLVCIFAAFLIRLYHLVPAYIFMILVMLAEHHACSRCISSGTSEKFSKPLLYLFSAVVLGFSGYIIFFVTPPATYVSFIGFMVLISMLFMDHPRRQSLFFGALIAVFILLEFTINPDPQTRADAILNVIVIPGCSLVMGWYNCGLKLLSFDAERRLTKLNMEDAGTGLLNRRYLFMNLKELCDKKEIDGVFMIDVDNFKQYNDCYGHLMGDKCLKTIAGLLQSYGKEQGIQFYRYGGDEFVGLCEKAAGVDMKTAAEELICAVRAANIDFSKWQEFSASISVGYAKTAGCGVEECIQKADTALYYAKRNGKGMGKDFVKPCEEMEDRCP